MQHLEQCDDVFGSAHISDAPLDAISQSNLLYMPATRDGSAGVFDTAGNAIPASVNFRGEGRVPIHQSLRMTWPVEAKRHNGPLFIYVGALFPHFGHFITTTLSRFWYLRRMQKRPVRLLCHHFGSPAGLFERTYAADIFRALDIGPRDFMTFNQPTIIQNEVVFPLPSFEENIQGNVAFIECSRAIGRTLLHDSVDSTDQPLYLSKAKLRQGVRGFVNEDEVDAELESRGVKVVYPETVPFREQVMMLSRHKFIMGSVGSALHNLIFLSGGKRVVGLNQTTRLNSNFLILDRLCENNSSYAYPIDQEEVESDRFNKAFRISSPREVARQMLDTLG